MNSSPRAVLNACVALAAGILVAGLAARLAYGVTDPGAYPEPIAGYVAIHGGNKRADLIAALTAVFCLAGTAAIVYAGLERLAEGKARAASAPTLLIGLAAAACTALGVVANTAMGRAPATSGWVLPILFAACAGLHARSSVRELAAGLLEITTAVFGGFGIALAADRILGLQLNAVWVLPGFAGLAALASQKAEAETRARLLLAAQACCALLYLVLLPQRFLLPGGGEFPFASTVWLRLFVVGLIVLAWVHSVRLHRRGGDSLERACGWSLAAACVFAAIPLTRAPIVSPDDYHFGERLLPYWSEVLHDIPAAFEVQAAHGLIDVLGAFVASVFLAPSVGYVSEGERIAYCLLLVALVATATRLVPVALVALAFVLIRPFQDQLAVVLLWLAVFALWNRPLPLLAAYVLLGPFAALFNIGIGAVAAVTAGLAVGIRLLRGWLDSGRSSRYAAIAFGMLVAGVVVALATGAGAELIEAARYVHENGPINLLAYGIPWRPPGEFREWILDALRGLYIALVGGWLAVVVIQSRAPTMPRRVLGVVENPLSWLVLFGIGCLPYAVGRVDANALSRVGMMAIAFATISMILFLRSHRHPGGVLLAATVAIGIAPAFHAGVDWSALEAAAVTSPIRVATTTPAGPETEAMYDPTHLARITEVKRVLDAVLRPDETYADLTNRNALYVYTGRRPVLEAAGYNSPGEEVQHRHVARLRALEPPVVLIGPEPMNFDGVTIALRAPLLFKEVVRRYEPMRVGAVTIGVLKQRAAAARAALSEAGLSVADSPVADELWRESFAMVELGELPSTWGQGLQRSGFTWRRALGEPALVHSLQKSGAGHYKPVGSDPHLLFDATSVGGDPAYLAFDAVCETTAVPARLEVYVSAAGEPMSETAVARFTLRNGRHLIPLDSIAAMATTRTLAQVRIDLQDQRSCLMLSVDDVELLGPWDTSKASAVDR